MNGLKTIKIFALFALFLAMKPPGGMAADKVTILAFGDSLTAGYGLAAEQGFTHQLERELEKRGINVSVINGGVSGDTTSGGLSRLEWLLGNGRKPDLVLLELGANDALRGIRPEITRANLDQMMRILDKTAVKTLIMGMLAPPNMGPEYSAAFNRIYPDLAQKYNSPLYPFFLDGVAGSPALNQRDGIHPNPQGVAIIVQKVAPYIMDSLRTP